MRISKALDYVKTILRRIPADSWTMKIRYEINGHPVTREQWERSGGDKVMEQMDDMARMMEKMFRQ